MSSEEVRESPSAGGGGVSSSLESVEEERSVLSSLVSGRDSCCRMEGKEGRLAELGCLHVWRDMMSFPLE